MYSIVTAGWLKNEQSGVNVHTAAMLLSSQPITLSQSACSANRDLQISQRSLLVCAATTKKSKADDYLRDFLVADAYASKGPTAQTLFHGKMLRSVRQNRSAFTKTALRNAKPKSIYTPGGIYLGELLSFTIDGNLTFPGLIRGLYYSVFGRRIPDNYSFNVRRLDPFTFEQTIGDALGINHLVLIASATTNSSVSCTVPLKIELSGFSGFYGTIDSQ